MYVAARDAERSTTGSDGPDGRLAAIIEAHRPILSARVPEDRYLSAIAAREGSHRFLGRSSQAVLQRQTAFLKTVLTGFSGRAAGDLRVLDWGCGKGHMTYLLRRQGFSVVACDRDDDNEDSAFGQQTPILAQQGIEVVALTDAIELPFPDQSFDCVTSFGVLEHVPDDRSSMREVHRVLRPGGVFYVSYLPCLLSWTQALARCRGYTYHDRLYRRGQLREMAQAAGFRVAAMWLGQLFPKNSIPLARDPLLEPLDRFLCRYTPLKFLATNIEAILVATSATRSH